MSAISSIACSVLDHGKTIDVGISEPHEEWGHQLSSAESQYYYDQPEDESQSHDHKPAAQRWPDPLGDSCGKKEHGREGSRVKGAAKLNALTRKNTRDKSNSRMNHMNDSGADEARG